MNISKLVDDLTDTAKDGAKSLESALDDAFHGLAGSGFQGTIDRVKSICRHAKPGDQVPLPWDLWESYSRALAGKPVTLDDGGTHPLRLPVDVPAPTAKKSAIHVPGSNERSKFAVCVFPVIK